MQLYLPIAEIPVDILLIIGIGASIGFISGLLGVGGGFLLTPLLIFVGIPTTIAVGTAAAQVVASSSSAALAYWRRRMIDLRLAMVLIVGGSLGSVVGVFSFRLLRDSGQLDLIIAVSYAVLLGLVGGAMLVESVRAIMTARRGQPMPLREDQRSGWAQRLPFRMRFRVSRLHISVIPLVGLGFAIGVLGAFLGIGGGFLVVPALIYFFRIPTSVVIGTSLLQIVGTMTVATVLHAVANQGVDAILALLLILGGVIGAQFGARSALFLKGETLRALLALLVLAVALRFMVDLVVTPAEIYSLSETVR